MKLKTKKIIAREFLYLIFAIGLGLISFFCTYLYNAYLKNKIENQTNEIFEKNKLKDSLRKKYDLKTDNQYWFFDKFSSYFDLSKDTSLNTKDKVWKLFDEYALNDSIKYKWENKWSKDGDSIIIFFRMVFLKPEVFESFLDRNRITNIDSTNHASSKALQSEIIIINIRKTENEKKILIYEKQKDFGLKVMFVSLLILLGVRYLYYSIKWSIKTINQKTE